MKITDKNYSVNKVNFVFVNNMLYLVVGSYHVLMESNQVLYTGYTLSLTPLNPIIITHSPLSVYLLN